MAVDYKSSSPPAADDGGRENTNTYPTSVLNPHDTSRLKFIPRHLFNVENAISREMAIDFNHHCKLGMKIGNLPNDPGEETLKGIILKTRSLIEGEMKAMVEDVIKRECAKRGVTYQGNPITKIDQLSRAWAQDVTLQEDLWHCCYGAFAKDITWETEYEVQVMKKLNFRYLEQDPTEVVGTDLRGNKGCIAKLARKVKRDVMKNVNRRALKTHKTIICAGIKPEIIGEYENGKKKYKKRKNTAGFNFDETLHTKVCLYCCMYTPAYLLII